MKYFMNVMKRVGLLLMLLPLLISTSAAATISIGNGSAGVGGTVVVPLMINDVTDAGSVEVNLAYDPSVVIPVNIMNSDFDLPPQDPPINPEFGYMIINAMQFDTGLDGNVKIGNITLQAIGGEGSSSPLSLKNVILQDIAMQDIPIDGVINGTFTIPSTGESATNGGGGSSSGGGGGGTSGEAFENIVCLETDREYVNKESYISYHYELECNVVEYINFTAVTSSGDIAAGTIP
jgi:hypothetical protein